MRRRVNEQARIIISNQQRERNQMAHIQQAAETPAAETPAADTPAAETPAAVAPSEPKGKSPFLKKRERIVIFLDDVEVGFGLGSLVYKFVLMLNMVFNQNVESEPSSNISTNLYTIKSQTVIEEPEAKRRESSKVTIRKVGSEMRLVSLKCVSFKL